MDILAWIVIWIFGTVLFAMIFNLGSFVESVQVALGLQILLLGVFGVFFILFWAFNRVGLL